MTSEMSRSDRIAELEADVEEYRQAGIASMGAIRELIAELINIRRLHELATENAARYSAVIEKARDLCRGSGEVPQRVSLIASTLSVDVSTVLRERDAAKWDEGEQHESRYLSTHGQFCPYEHCNPYRDHDD